MSITQSVITKNERCSEQDINAIDNSSRYPYLGLKQLRIQKIPITDLTGRSNGYGDAIKFNISSYEEQKIPITDLTERSNGYGDGIIFNTNNTINGENINISSYEEQKMRRKAEYLKYRSSNQPGYNLNNFSDIVNNPTRNLYSKAKLKELSMSNTTTNCKIILTPPSNAGIKNYSFSGYYLSPNVKFLQYL